jgi:hypothetical protein
MDRSPQRNNIMQLLAVRPEGPAVNSQGRKPLVDVLFNLEPQRGNSVAGYFRPFRAFVSIITNPGAYAPGY